MSTALQQLVNFAKAPQPGFICTNGGRSEKTKRQFLARVRHVLNPPATAEGLALLRSMLGHFAPEFELGYREFDGFTLYQDALSDTAGIEALPVAKWKEATEDMREFLADLSEEDDPDHIRKGVAFATVPQSGNYFVVPVEGPSAGKVFYADHDGWYESHFASGFDEFISRVMNEPAVLLSDELGCYTRYSDGKTSIQWVPEKYVLDCSDVNEDKMQKPQP